MTPLITSSLMMAPLLLNQPMECLWGEIQADVAFSLASAKVPEDPKAKPGRENGEKKGNRNGNVAIWMVKVQFVHVFCIFFQCLVDNLA